MIRAIDQINALKPDVIFFTGDLVNNYAWELRGWEAVFNKLNAKKGKYAILGNHDYGDYSKWNCIKDKQENFEAIKQFFKTIGLDVHLSMHRGNGFFAIVEKIKKLTPKTVTLAELSVTELPYGDNSFDYIVHTLVFCSVDDVDKGLSEIKRVLKPIERLQFSVKL